jgi:hypothetical protein
VEERWSWQKVSAGRNARTRFSGQSKILLGSENAGYSERRVRQIHGLLIVPPLIPLQTIQADLRER